MKRVLKTASLSLIGVLTGLILAVIPGRVMVRTMYGQIGSVRLDPTSSALFERLNANLSAAHPGPRVVLLGDSRIEQWRDLPRIGSVEYVNRGSGGDTSMQSLLRADRDCVALQADLLIIGVGINDLKFIGVMPEKVEAITNGCFRNIQSIITKTRSMGAKTVLLTIAPPDRPSLARRLFWSDRILTAVEDVNRMLSSLEAEDVVILDAWSLLQRNRWIRREYARDDLHFTKAAYDELGRAMNPLVAGLLGEGATEGK